MCHNFFYQSPFWTFELLPNILKRKEGCDGNASYIKESLGNMVKPSDQTSTLFSNSFFLLWKWCPSELWYISFPGSFDEQDIWPAHHDGTDGIRKGKEH